VSEDNPARQARNQKTFIGTQMNTDKECLKFEMPKMPKIESGALSPLTPNSLRARGSAPLQTPNFF
jgi:hypothetical protein